MSYSFPCQDLSLVGYKLGMKENSGTRSSMLWEVGRILREMKEMNQLPDVLMMENVPQVCNGKNKQHFDKWLKILEHLVYTSYYKILSATDFGVPQTRKRCFCVSILNGKGYVFPDGWKLDKCLKDVLEDKVDDKYYLSESKMKIVSMFEEKRSTDSELIKIGRLNYDSDYNFRSDIFSVNGSASTLTTGDSAHPILIGTIDNTNRVRRLTPRESFRLMGVKDEDFDKIKDTFADNKLYHLAGDSIVVDVLMNIFKEML